MRKIVFALLVIIVATSGLFAQTKVPAPKDQLYIEVSALGNLDYFFDHKMGMEMVGKELGVRTEYVGPAEYDMNAMVAAFEATPAAPLATRLIAAIQAGEAAGGEIAAIASAARVEPLFLSHSVFRV